MLPEYEPGPFDLDALNEKEAAELWRELGAWVEWLRWTYRIGTKVDSCWYRHPGLVRELVAAFADWRGAYADDAGPGGPAAWHNYTLWPMIRRIGDLAATSECAYKPCSYVAKKPETEPEAFADFVAEDVAARHSSPPDELTGEQMENLVSQGDAESTDLDDRGAPVIYQDVSWNYDETDEVFRPR